MKNLTFQARWLLAAGALTGVIPFADAQEQATQPPVTANVQVTAPPKLPYGVDDVLKLSQAKISDDIIINYIHNSGTVYTLQPNDIVYLRNQGVSDQVLNVMVNQRTQVAVTAQAEAAQNAAAAAQNQIQPAPAPYDQYAAAEAPAAPAPSTVYVIPNSAAYTGYAPSYSYSYPYYYGGYYGPVVSFGLGYCGPTYYHGGYHGYYHGGYGGWHGGYYGGGWHGSSGWHGGGIHVASTGFHGGGGGVHVASGGFHGGGGGARGGGSGFHGSAHR